MSIAAALPISTLTEDQAVEELARICDLAPDESDQLAFVHWKQEFSKRAQQLEQHIVHLQKVAGVDALPGPEPETQNAPPHHLQPEPAPGPAATKEKLMPPTSTPDPIAERLSGLLVKYNDLAQQVPTAPNSKACTKIRQTMHNTKFAIRSLCNRNGLPVPELLEVPPNPFSEVPAPAVPFTKKSAPAPTVDLVEEETKEPTSTLPPVEELSGKAGPGPYVEPTAEDLRALLPDQPVIHITESHVAGDPRELAEAIRRVVQAGNQNRAAIDRQASTADIDQRDRFAMEPPFFVPGIQSEPTAQDRARDIQRLFWPLCQSIEDLPDREAIRPALDVIHARLQTAYALLDEALVSEAG